MLAAVWLWMGAWEREAQADDDEPVPTLATQLKRGLIARFREQTDIQLLEVRLFPNIISMSKEEIEARLSDPEPLIVGILETREHGRLRVSCHQDTCQASAGSTTIELELIREAVPETRPRKGTGARRQSAPS